MTIETKFNIGALVQHKYQRAKPKSEVAVAYEVMEIQAINCYTTAQVFYTCRALHLINDVSWESNKKVYTIEDIAPGFGQKEEYIKFREDELKVCDEEAQKIIRNEVAQ